MTFRIGTDANALDASLAQIALLNHGERVDERSCGIDVAANNEKLTHASLAGDASKHALQHVSACETSRRDMDDRLEPGFAQYGRRRNRFVGSRRCNRGDIDRSARLQNFE